PSDRSAGMLYDGNSMTQRISRRQVLVDSAVAAALAVAEVPGAGAADAGAGKLKVLVIGAHPGDPEAGCGGTMARCADRGDDVVAIYFTRGEAGISGKSAPEAAAIRTAEAEAA